jgi:hypothetical protein
MATPEEQRREEEEAIEQERTAFHRRQKAFLAVHRQFLPFGNGVPSVDSLNEMDEAEAEWRRAVAVCDRIRDEIRSGRRR